MNRAKELFLYAVESLEPQQWPDFLTEACDGDETLQASVARLLEAHQQPDSLLNGAEDAAPGLDQKGDSTGRIGSMVGRYKLLEEIGEGGFANVFLAEQSEPVRRQLAVKILKLGMDTKEIVARFEVERQALAVMDHPNIARVIDGGATGDGRPYFVMELIDGLPITQYCDKYSLDTHQRLQLFTQVAQAVQHAHQKGIVHRDIKPSNVLVTRQNDEASPKVIDFGIAKLISKDNADKTLITRHGQFIGTPQYISPEQAQTDGRDVDTRTDIYSLGVLLYELLTGSPPFDAERFRAVGIAELVQIISKEQPPRPSQRLSDSGQLQRLLKRDLDWIVMKAMDKNPDRRYVTAAALADDIQRYLSQEPVLARPPSLGYRVQKFARRNKLGLATGLAFAAVLVAGTIVGISLARKAHREATRANATLSELRSSATAFFSEARALVAKGQFDEAVTKLDHAIRLQPENADYLVAKADLLESQLKFEDAALAYRAALALDPNSSRAETHLQKCSELFRRRDESGDGFSLELLADLHALMQREQRSAAELLPIARILGEEQKHVLDFWLRRLEALPITGKRLLRDRLTVMKGGDLSLDLSHTQIRDLSPLVGMPLSDLNLSHCSQLKAFEILTQLPLESLNLSNTLIRDLSPLRNSLKLEALNVSSTLVRDLEPLSDLPLKQLSLEDCPIDDLTALQQMSLEGLNIAFTGVHSLESLRGMPLRELDASYIPASDIRVLRGAPLEKLILSGTSVSYLAFMRGMPLRQLSLWACNRAHKYSVLGELESLEVLQLPGGCINFLSTGDRAAIDALEKHLRLTQVSDRLPANGRLTSIEHGQKFWPKWRAMRALQQRLLEQRIQCKITSDEPGTWDLEIVTPAFDDLSILADEPIRELNINSTKVSDLSPISEMPNLQTLWAGMTAITSLEPLRGTSIARLNLFETEVRDLSPLAEVSNLRQLWLGNTPIESLEPLSGLKLTTLRLENTAISDLSPLKGMPIETLCLSGTRVTDLEPLRGAPLKTLFLNFAPISDVSPLAECQGLERVLLPVAARDASSLRSLRNLDWVEYGWSPVPNNPATTVREFWNQMETQGHRPPLDQAIPSLEPLARNGLYNEAAGLLKEFIVGAPDDETVLMRMVICGLHVAAENQEDHRREAESLLAQTGSTESPYLADQTLKACLVSSSPVGTKDVWERLGARVRENRNDVEFQPWLHLSAALCSYRMKEYEQTIQHAVTLVHRQQLSLEAKVAALALRSMAYGKLGREEEAQADLAEGERLIAAYWPFPQQWSRASWHDWFIARVLLDEASRSPAP